ncbi:MAG: type II secretion system protein [Gemmataceae bacterium]
MLANTPLNSRSRRSAFTLVEVLVVMAIIVILASVATVGVMRYLDNAKENVDESRMRNLITAYKSYNLKTGGDSWPSDPSIIVNPDDGGRPYLDGGIEAITNPWGIRYSVDIGESSTGSGPTPYVHSQRPTGTFTLPKH